MKLIDRYVNEIGKRLPAKTRADIENELRSTLEDMLEDRATQAGRPADEALAADLLKEYGAPDKVAATYQPAQYLIGPRLYPFFMMVLKIVVSVLTGVAIFGFGIRFGTGALTTQAFIAQLGKSLLEYFGGLMSAFGNIVIVFAILQRVLPESEFEDEKNEWNPADLMKEPEPDDVTPWEPIFTIAFTVAGLVIFNFYPNLLGFSFNKGDVWVFIPALSEAFFRMLPFINLAWILQIALQLVLLRQGRWTPASRWFSLGIELLGVGIAVALLMGPPIIAFDITALADSPLQPDTVTLLGTIFQQIGRWALIIAIVVGGADAVKTLVRIFKK